MVGGRPIVRRTAGSARDFWRDPPWWFRDVFIVLVIGAVFFAAQLVSDNRAAQRDEERDNLRFVRDRSGPDLQHRPFSGIHLEGSDLHGLLLRGADFSEAHLDGVDLRDADLRGADLSYANLEEALVLGADLGDVTFFEGDLSGANLSTSTLADTNFERADLRGTHLGLVDLETSNLRGACWDDKTIWPADFVPPDKDEGECDPG